MWASLFIIVMMFLGTIFGADTQKEDFISFLIKFSYDTKFQSERIIFPLQKEKLSSDLSQNVHVFINKKNWEPVHLLKGNQNYMTDIQYSFNEVNHNSSERVLVFLGLENGINVKYYFKLYNNLWYLKKIVDYST